MQKLLICILYFYCGLLFAKGSKSDLSLDEKIQEQILRYIRTHVIAVKNYSVLSLPRYPDESTAIIADSLAFDMRKDSIIVTHFMLWKEKYPKLDFICVYSSEGMLISKKQYSAGICNSLSEYNNRGQLTLHYHSNSYTCDEGQKDSLYLDERMEYNAAGQQIADYSFSADGSLFYKSQYAYNEKGEMTEEINFRTHENFENMPDSLDYSEYNRLMEKKLPKELYITSRTKYRIDSIKRTVVTEEYTDSLLDRRVIKYNDELWRPVKSIYINYPHPVRRPTFAFLSNISQREKPKSKKELLPNTTITTTRYTQKGTKYSEVFFVNGRKSIETITTVNANNDPLEIIVKYDDPKLNKKSTFGYDANGNLIKQTLSEAGKESLTKTTIYYQ